MGDRAVGPGDLLIGAIGGIDRGGDAGAGRIDPLVALALRPIGEGDGREAAGDGLRQIVGCIGDRAPVARYHVAIEVIAIGGVLGAGDGRHRVLAGGHPAARHPLGIGIGADIRLRLDIAEPSEVVAHRHRRGPPAGPALPDGARSQPVEIVVNAVLGKRSGAKLVIAAMAEIADRVEDIAEVLEARAIADLGRDDRLEPAALGIIGADRIDLGAELELRDVAEGFLADNLNI